MMRRFLARQDVEQLFLRAKCGDLSLEKLTSVCATMGNDEDMGVVRQLFEELDVNEDGKVSMQEFKQGLRSVPMLEDLGVLKGLLRSLNQNDSIKTHLMDTVTEDEKEGRNNNGRGASARVPSRHCHHLEGV